MSAFARLSTFILNFIGASFESYLTARGKNQPGVHTRTRVIQQCYGSGKTTTGNIPILVALLHPYPSVSDFASCSYQSCRYLLSPCSLFPIMRFLLQFRGLHNDLRLSEFLSVVATCRNLPTIQPSTILLAPAYQVLTGVNSPNNVTRGAAGVVLYGEIFYYCHLLSEAEAAAVAARTVLLRAIYVPVGHGRNYDQCVASVDTEPFAGALSTVRDARKKPSFRCIVDAFGKSLDLDQQLERIHRFPDMLQSFPGRVKLKCPDVEICILEDAFPLNGHGYKQQVQGPRQVFVARRVADGCGHIGSKYSLKRRRYIGPTSMDAELAFVMANMAGVGKGDLVLDPFCGTGGIMVACKAMGAHVVGGDINILALRGKGHGTDVAANFEQYGLGGPLGLLRADVLNSPIREGKLGWFDAVVCDPPYGIKEGMRVFREDTIAPGLGRNHFQGTERVRFIDFLHGILQFAVQVLVVGGKLVYWLPTTPEYCEMDLPTHPGLRLLFNCEQPLTTRMSRRMITMVRVSDKEKERIEKESIEKSTEIRRGGGRDRMPAHFDLACKLLRQPERAEERLRSRSAV